MPKFIGEYECKMDGKGRVMLPAHLRKQIPDEAGDRLVVNRGFDKCLTLYTKTDWQNETDKLQGLNSFNKKDRMFIRLFNNGATEVQIDTASRVLIPKKLQEYAELENELVLYAYENKIEIWSAKNHAEMFDMSADDFSELAEEVMGKLDNKKGAQMSEYHVPVMLSECIEALDIKPNGVYVDVTYGGGGHSREILNKLGSKGKLVAFDQDADAINNKVEDERLILVNHNFRYLKNFLKYHDALPADGLLADLGISSYQIDEPQKGFAHRWDAALDMRMDQNATQTAADIVNGYDERKLMQVLKNYGELDNAYKVTKNIINARQIQAIKTTGQLKEAVVKSLPRDAENKYLSKIFQALRIEVNQELEVLEHLLNQSAQVLGKGGRLVIMSYHSLEDRMVKNFIKTGNIEGKQDKDIYGNSHSPFKAVVTKAIIANDDELARNPRARSAKLRIAEKL